MKKKELRFSDDEGHSTTLTKNELSFFGSRVSASKFYNGLFVVKRMVQNMAFYPLFLLAKGFLNTILGKKNYLGLPLSWEDYHQIVVGVLGFCPAKIQVTFGDCGIALSAEPKQCLIISLIQINEIVLCNQYNISRRNISGKTIIDAGANQGIFSIYAAKLGARKIYAFEPIAGTYEQLRRNITLNGLDGAVVPRNSALGEKKGKQKMFYNFAGDAGASFGGRCQKSMSQLVEIGTVDAFMQKKGKLDFIKIDAEGSEQKILLGAKDTIRKYKPVLSFSAYHNPDDKVRLPSTVSLIRPDYLCVLMNRCEEDFYCD